jgi:tetratricopeptide (TPR) repeat protein
MLAQSLTAAVGGAMPGTPAMAGRPMPGMQPQAYPSTLPHAAAPRLPQQTTSNKRAVWIGLAATVAAVVVFIAVGYYFYSRATPERKLEAAIDSGNLLRPAGESAFDYYRQLGQKGLNAQLSEKLLSAVTARPQQMLADLSTPGNADTTLADWQEAQTLLNWATELRPNDNALAARANYCAARVASMNNRKDEAITYWKRAAEQDATWALPLNSIGLVYNERKDYSRARSFFFEAIRREPQFALPYNNIGTSFFYEKDDVQAEDYYRQAIERAPQWPRPHAWLGEIAMQRKAYDWAVQEFEAVLNLDPAGTSGIDLNKVRQQLEQARSLTQQADGEPGTGTTPTDVLPEHKAILQDCSTGITPSKIVGEWYDGGPNCMKAWRGPDDKTYRVKVWYCEAGEPNEAITVSAHHADIARYADKAGKVAICLLTANSLIATFEYPPPNHGSLNKNVHFEKVATGTLR